jgi:hypothetical protein
METFDVIDFNFFLKISKSVRKVEIPKPDKFETRSSDIGSFNKRLFKKRWEWHLV